MVKPMGVLLILGLALALLLCLVPVLRALVRSIRNRARMATVVLGISAAGIAALSAWAVYTVAPNDGQTIAQLELPGGRVFVVRTYRSGWLEYPKARLYVRDTQGTWTSFALIAELVNPRNTPLALDVPAQEVKVGTAGWYRISDNDFVNPDGSRAATWQLPPGVEPGEEG